MLHGANPTAARDVVWLLLLLLVLVIRWTPKLAIATVVGVRPFPDTACVCCEWTGELWRVLRGVYRPQQQPKQQRKQQSSGSKRPTHTSHLCRHAHVRAHTYYTASWA